VRRREVRPLPRLEASTDVHNRAAGKSFSVVLGAVLDGVWFSGELPSQPCARDVVSGSGLGCLQIIQRGALDYAGD
jgi:hypothetical protein